MKTRPLFSIVIASTLTACAGTTPEPMSSAPPEPTHLKVLGAVYTVPEYIHVERVDEAPGFAKLSYESALTGCKGFLFFNTVGSKQAHDDYVHTNFDEGGISKSLSAQHIVFERSEDGIAVLGAQGKLVRWKYVENQHEVESGLYEVFVPEQSLSFASLHDCPLGLLQKESQVVTHSLESQRTF